MAYIAASDIKHGRGEDKEPLLIAEGEKVRKSDFSSDEWDALMEAGAIIDTSAAEAEEEPEAEGEGEG